MFDCINLVFYIFIFPIDNIKQNIEFSRSCLRHSCMQDQYSIRYR